MSSQFINVFTTPGASVPQGSAVAGGSGVKSRYDVAGPLWTLSDDRESEGVVSLASSTLYATSAGKQSSAECREINVKSCFHFIKKKKRKYLLFKGYKKCVVCKKRWCDAKCSDCGKFVHRRCVDKNKVIITFENENDYDCDEITSNLTRFNYYEEIISPSSHCSADSSNDEEPSEDNEPIDSEDHWMTISAPIADVNIAMVNAINKYIDNYYDRISKILDLSKFFRWRISLDDEQLLPMNRPEVVSSALHMVHDNVDDLYCLRLGNNLLRSGDGLKDLPTLFPDLKVLDLTDNRLTDLEQLSCLSGYKIRILSLKDNPVDQTVTRTLYTLSVQKIFPKLCVLNDTELEPLYRRIDYTPPHRSPLRRPLAINSHCDMELESCE